MLMRLQPYDITISYTPGVNVAVADALSRLPPREPEPIEGLDVQIHDVCTQFSTNMLERIKDATATDQELCTLKEIVFTGWPELRSEVHEQLHKYWNFRDEISIDNGILFKGQRIIALFVKSTAAARPRSL